jgi:MFS family permease
MSVGILFLYMAFNSVNNIQSTLMEADGFNDIGFYVLAFLYLCMGIGSLISTAIINKYGTKVCLIAGGVGNFVYILAQMMVGAKYQFVIDDNIEDFQVPDWFIKTCLFISAFVNGITVGVLWSASN